MVSDAVRCVEVAVRILRPILGSAILVAVVACWVMGRGKSPQQQAAVGVSGSALYDFGECRQGETLAHTFSLINESRATIEIGRLKTSCQCLIAGTRVGIQNRRLAPGEELEVPVRFQTRANQEALAGEVIIEYANLDGASQAGQTNFVKLEVRANIIPDFRISPRELDFGSISGIAVKEVRRTLRVEPVALLDLAIHEVSCSNPRLRARLLPRAADDSAYEIEVTLDVSDLNESRSVGGTLILATTSERLPKANVRVLGEYNAAAEAEPGMIVVGSNVSGEVVRELRVTTCQAGTIRAVRSTAEGRLSIEEHESGSVGREHLLRIHILPCKFEPLDCEVEVDVEIQTEDNTSVLRTLRVPVHRFLEKGSENAQE